MDTTSPQTRRLEKKRKYNAKKRARKRVNKAKLNNQRCYKCLSRNCTSKNNSEECNNFKVCNRCLIRVSPATVKFCATSCRRKIRFAEKICKIHHGILCFGDICKSCTPSAIISSIDASGVCIQDSPVNEELLMIISGGNVTFDRYGIF
ncbi:unnamed protein product [Meganyctiphanes norvegica]|uniref:Uncharacterized protein n=1 Tax=Meganyctiphanes norvegica TaxID=48144 RepID=A0AAV2QR19_MEGNR